MSEKRADTVKVSVLVPCCNVSAFVRECLESIVGQTLKEIEIICINDGSTDNTLDIIQEFAARDSRIRVLDKKNSGYGDSMNKGLEMARGEYIGIVESDDFVEPGMFEKLYSAAKANDLDICRSQYWFYKDGVDTPCEIRKVPFNTVFTPLRETKVIFAPPAIWTSIYRRSMLIENGIAFLPTPGASFQDTGFAFKTFVCCRRFMLLPDLFLHYRQHANNSVKSDKKIFCVADEWAEIIRFCRERDDWITLKTLIPRVSFHGYRWNFARLSHDAAMRFFERWRTDWLTWNKEVSLVSVLRVPKKLYALLLLYCPALARWYFTRKFEQKNQN